MRNFRSPNLEMGCCTGRCVFLFFCALQLIAAVERQVFDFLGYQWAPILVNFLHVIVVILGLFGTVHYKPKYIILYIVWTLFWVTWNIFICCLYLDLGGLSKDSDYLSFGLSSHRTWWKDNSLACKNGKIPNTRWHHLNSPAQVSELGCMLEYQYIEVLHSALQLFLSALGFVFASYILFHEDEDTYLYK